MIFRSESNIQHHFSSRWGFLVSVLGIAVGTGNIWRFPRIAAQNGGIHGAGAFLISWIFSLFFWSIPLIIAEYIIGRKSRMAPLGAFRVIAGARFTWMGGFVTFVSASITFYYSVVVGWCLFYLIQTLITPLPSSINEAFTAWENFQNSTWPFLFHGIAVGIGILVIWRGIRTIEMFNRWVIPALLIIMVISLVRSLTLPGAFTGIKYLFTPEWRQLLEPTVWLEALTQNAWDTGAGWGLFLTYATYMKKEHGVVKNAFFTGIGNNLISLLAGLIIFGTVFSILGNEMLMSREEILTILRSSGPASTGLTLIWLPQLFSRIILGTPLLILFFLGLTFAGFSSLVAMLELQTRVLIDSGLPRSSSVILVGAASYLFGIPSALSLSFFANQDFVWGLALIISGAFVAFAVAQHGCSKIRREQVLILPNDFYLAEWWDFAIKYVVPLTASILLVWWLFLALTVYEPTEWYNPLVPHSVMTCLLQWGAVLSVLWILNQNLVKRLVKQ